MPISARRARLIAVRLPELLEQHDPLARRAQPPKAVERVCIGARTVMQHAPLIDDEALIARGDVGKPRAEGRLDHRAMRSRT